MSDATERPADDPAEGPGSGDGPGPGSGDGPGHSSGDGPGDGSGPGDGPEADAWERACAEDLAAERARRREQYGEPGPGSAAEELRKLAEAVAERIAGLSGPLAGTAVQGAVQQLIAQAKSAVEPVIERNPGVFEHLANAGGELLAAYREAVESHERQWSKRDEGGESSSSEHIDLD